MPKLTPILCILFAFVCMFSNATVSRPHSALHASAPENPPSCDGLKFKMHACSPYLIKDSSMPEPGASCCSGFMDVWKDNSNCSDQVFKSIVNLTHVNETRVAHVSSTCGFSDIFLDKYLASLLEARADKAEAELAAADLAEMDQAKEDQDETHQAEVDQAKAEQVAEDQAEAYKGVLVFVGVVVVTAVVVFSVGMCLASFCRHF